MSKISIWKDYSGYRSNQRQGSKSDRLGPDPQSVVKYLYLSLPRSQHISGRFWSVFLAICRVNVLNWQLARHAHTDHMGGQVVSRIKREKINIPRYTVKKG
jgi:hypothetical protein